jgi:hypothetical protein
MGTNGDNEEKVRAGGDADEGGGFEAGAAGIEDAGGKAKREKSEKATAEKKKMETERERTQLLRQLGYLTGIPVVMLVYMVLGWLGGKWLDERFHGHGKITFVVIMFCIAGAFREIILMTKKLMK